MGIRAKIFRAHGQVPAQIPAFCERHCHFQMREVPAHYLNNVGIGHGAADVLFRDIRENHFCGAVCIFPKPDARVLLIELVQGFGIAGAGSHDNIGARDVFGLPGHGACIAMADQLFGNLGVGRAPGETLIPGGQVGQPGCRQVGIAGFQRSQNFAGGFQHGPFHLPATLFGVGADQRMLGTDRIFVAIQVIGGGAIAGGDFECPGFRRWFELCCRLCCRLLAVIFTAAGEYERQDKNAGGELPSGHSEEFPVF